MLCKARVCQHLALPTSGRTLLRILHKIPLPDQKRLRVIGIDDWAWRKGQRYGTIICDLERRCVVDLLPDTELETVVCWLEQHPGIEIITRDGSIAFADAINKGAPQARQVADRWHLIHSLARAAEQVIKAHRTCLTIKELPSEATALPQDFPIGSSNRARSKAANARRREHLAREISTRYAKGETQKEIAAALQVSLSTVRNYLYNYAEATVERKVRPVGTKSFHPFIPYIQQRWSAGCQNASQIWREVAAQGYHGSVKTVIAFVGRLRQGLPLESCLPYRRQV